MQRKTTGFRIFIRYGLTNLLILLIPFILSGLYYRISYNAIKKGVDALAETRLSQSLQEIERLFYDIQKINTQLTQDYTINRYLTKGGRFSDIEIYNMKDLSSRLSSYVMSNKLLSHSLLYLASGDFFIYENGFSSIDRFYGGFFKVGNYNAVQWKNLLRNPEEDNRFIKNIPVQLGSSSKESHIWIFPIGQGQLYRGSLVQIIDNAEIQGLLSGVLQEWGGWCFLDDGEGRLIASTSDRNDLFYQLPPDPETHILQTEKESYRIYRMTSGSSGWVFTALLSESRIFGSLIQFRNMAYALLSVGFVLGTILAFFMAYTNSRPLEKLFNQIIGQTESRGKIGDLFDKAEKSVLKMAHEQQHLQSEVQRNRRISRIYFLQNLLAGNFKSRKAYDLYRTQAGISFENRAYKVVVCHLSALHEAGSPDVFLLLREALTNAVKHLTGDSFLSVTVSFDDMAFFMMDGPDSRHEIFDFSDKVLEEIPKNLRGHYTFGVGNAYQDPFLLVQSYQQAISAVNASSPGSPRTCLFYEEMPRSPHKFLYSLDLEAGILQAIRSGNTDMIRSLMDELIKENCKKRDLIFPEKQHLIYSLKNTFLRTTAEFPDSENLAFPVLDQMEESSFEKLIEKITTLFQECASYRDLGKKSHNSYLAESIKSYIEGHYSHHDLGLCHLAGEFSLSENYLSNFYKEQTGECISAVILRYRMEASQRALQTTFLPIEIIADNCGYSSTATFRRAFKKYSAVTPSEFRNKNLQPVYS